MKINEAIKAAMARNNIKPKDIIQETGIASNTLANQLSGERNLSLDKVDALLLAIGYKMMIVPNEAVPQPGWYEVTSNKLDGVERESDGKQ